MSTCEHNALQVDVLEPVFEAQARAGKPMQIRVGGKDGLDLIGIKCKNAAGRPGHEDSTAPWGIGVAISIDALAIMGDPELFAIVLNDWAGILGGGIPALAQPFPRTCFPFALPLAYVLNHCQPCNFVCCIKTGQTVPCMHGLPLPNPLQCVTSDIWSENGKCICSYLVAQQGKVAPVLAAIQ